MLLPDAKKKRVRLVEWFSRTRNSAVSSNDASSRDANEALRALNAAIRSHTHDGSDRERLRSLVLAYGRHARDEKLTPERMLVHLKHELDDALAGTSDDPLVREVTRTDIVKLAIDAYYDGQA